MKTGAKREVKTKMGQGGRKRGQAITEGETWGRRGRTEGAMDGRMIETHNKQSQLIPDRIKLFFH